MCGQPQKLEFHVPDDLWLQVIDPPFQTLAVCLYCFDESAAAKGIPFAAADSELWFAGRQTILQLEIARSY